jgi:hypothetical protein
VNSKQKKNIIKYITVIVRPSKLHTAYGEVITSFYCTRATLKNIIFASHRHLSAVSIEF